MTKAKAKQKRRVVRPAKPVSQTSLTVTSAFLEMFDRFAVLTDTTKAEWVKRMILHEVCWLNEKAVQAGVIDAAEFNAIQPDADAMGWDAVYSKHGKVLALIQERRPTFVLELKAEGLRRQMQARPADEAVEKIAAVNGGCDDVAGSDLRVVVDGSMVKQTGRPSVN